MIKKYIAVAIIAIVFCITFSACDTTIVDSSKMKKNTTSSGNSPTYSDSNSNIDVGIDFTKSDKRDTWDNDSCIKISLSDGASTCSSENVKIDGNIINIQSEGTYLLEGTLSDGRIIVNVDKTVKVHLIFNGVNVTSKTSSPFYVASADKVIVTLAENSTNTFVDNLSYTDDPNADGAPNGCFYSREDLTINGKGSLTVKGNYNNGISSSNDIKIIDSTINVEAVKNGIKGKGSVSIKSGVIDIKAHDGIKSDEESKVGKGVIYIIGGDITIKASDDALQATNMVVVTSGSIKTNAAGKKINCGGTVSIADGCLN